jgi:5-methylcytosine-specific restriction enzyme subunit McrC
MATQLRLREHFTTHRVLLTTTERDALRLLLPSMRIEPEPGEESLYALTPGSVVGALRVGAVEIHVLPKLSIRRLFFLLAYAIEGPLWSRHNVRFEADDTLTEIFASAFLWHLRSAVRGGLLTEYLQIQATASVLRGHLRFGEQIARHLGRVPPLEIAFDDLSVDNQANRILKGALRCLKSVPVRSAALRGDLASALALFADVRDMEFLESVPRITYTRLNQHYRPAVELAYLILNSRAVSTGPGNYSSAGFLVDMDVVVERFVLGALRNALHLSAASMPAGAKGKNLYLGADQRIRLEPDISWWRGPACCFVADVKYKDLQPGRAHNADLYQILSYAVAASTRSGMLIYASSGTASTIHVVHRANKLLKVVALDLTEDPNMILQRIEGIADEIRSQVEGGANLAHSMPVE